MARQALAGPFRIEQTGETGMTRLLFAARAIGSGAGHLRGCSSDDGGNAGGNRQLQTRRSRRSAATRRSPRARPEQPLLPGRQGRRSRPDARRPRALHRARADDAAFGKLPAGTRREFDEAGIARATDRRATYHILPGTILAEDIGKAIDNAKGKAVLATMGGGTLTATARRRQDRPDRWRRRQGDGDQGRREALQRRRPPYRRGADAVQAERRP